MPYTPTTWTNGSTALSQTAMNNLETQYAESTQSFERDLLTAYVHSGLVASRHNSYNAAVLADSPVAYYRLDESSGTTVAEAINGRNLTSANCTLGVTGGLTGDPDTAYTFNGTTSKATGSGFAGLPSGNAAWTIEAWIKFASNPAANATIAVFGVNASNEIPDLFIDTAGKFNVSPGGASMITSASALSTATWHHVVGTWDGTTMKAYVDGTQVASNTFSAIATPSTGQIINIGVGGAGTTLFWSGQIDEVAIYATALSSTRISAHYSAGTTATTQVDVTSGVAFLTQTDSTLRRRAPTSSTQTTSALSSTYNLYLQPDGTWYWSTSNSPAANSLAVATVTTDGSGNVSLVTDARTQTTTLLSGMGGEVAYPAMSSVGGQTTAGSFGVPVIVAQAVNQHISATGLTIITQFNPPIKGLYRFNFMVSVGANSGNLEARIGYSDASPLLHGATHEWFTWAGNPSVLLNGSNAVSANVTIATLPLTAYCDTTVSLTIAYNNPNAAPNDYACAMIERLS